MKRVFAHIGFSFAFTLILLNLVSEKWVPVIFGVTGALFAVSLFIKKYREAVAVPLCLGCAVIACLLFTAVYNGAFLPQQRLDGSRQHISFYISDLEEESESGYIYTVKTKSIGDKGTPQNIKLRLKSDFRINADYYQLLEGDVKLNKIAENGFESYGYFGDGIFLSANLESYRAEGKAVKSPLKYIISLKRSIRQLFNEELGGDCGGLALALVTGYKNNISENVIGDFRAAGASHVMAVSGLHLAVFSGGLYWSLRKLHVPKISGCILSILSILFYISLSGFSKSVIRAGIMMTVLFAARAFKEKSDSLNSLGFSVFLICFNPYAVTDSGALLTVTAVLGLLIIYPVIKSVYFPKIKLIGYFYKIITASVSVFITTFPVMFLFFGYVSVIGTFANIIMIPAAQFSLVTAFLTIIFGRIPITAPIFAFLCRAGTETMLYVAGFCAKLSFAMVDVNSAAGALIISAVLIITGISIVIKRTGTMKICAAVCIVVILTVSTVSYAVNYNCVYVRILSGYYSTAVIIYDKDNAAVIGLSDSSQYYTAKRIIESNSLDVSLIIDTNSDRYSEKLSSEFRVKNYAVGKYDSDDNEINCGNIFALSDFNVDLWDTLNIKYISTDTNNKILFTVYNTRFDYISDGSTNEYSENQIESYYTLDYDIVYTVNHDGFAERRVNKWLK